MKKEKVGRNQPCPCGSGKKYKNCCGGTAATGNSPTSRALVLLLGSLLLIGTIGFVRAVATSEAEDTPAAVWSPEHGHYH